MAAIGIVLALTMVGLGFVLNHLVARLAFVELALTYGPPPVAAPDPAHSGAPSAANGESNAAPIAIRPFEPAEAALVLPRDAVIIFASATCSTCVRLVDDLSDPSVTLDRPLHLYFESDPPIVARSGTIHERQSDLIDRLRVPALPYAVITIDGAVGAHGSVATPSRLDNLLALAGVAARLPEHLVSAR